MLYSRRLPVQGRELFRWVHGYLSKDESFFQVGPVAACPTTRAFKVGPWLPVQRRELFRWVHDYLSKDKSFSGESMAIRPRDESFSGGSRDYLSKDEAFQVGPWLPV